ncbi:hypothetical protein C8A00DRAFT_35415 [Chaetomidium leptoderma]|uniref:Chromo domain-containing protein n=1 Tax=Chaetomidium leptoderma TaxID=669021 RepID=A0AAN6ZV05_9PEZI|nr:hypothetical protein C8A00DRAFT_35415 [Chaetomidium leptoderma]
MGCSPTLLDDESTGEPEPADAEPSLPPQSPSGTAPRHGVDLQQRSSSGGLSPHPDHCDDNQASDPEEHYPLTPDDRGEKGSEEGPAALPQAQESAAGPPTLPDDEGNNGHELADASPPMQPPAGRDQASGRGRSTRPFRQCRRRDADEEEDSVYSNAEHSEDDVVQPPPRKRRRGATCGDSRRPRRQRGTAHPPPSPEGGTEMDGTAAATFEEWPLGDTVLKRVTKDGSPPTFMVEFTWDLCAEHATCEEWPLGDAVLKRVIVDGSPPTFMVQFTWDPRAEHGAGYYGTDNQGTSAKSHRPARQKSNGITKHKDKLTSTSRRARYTLADDAEILRLKGQGLPWTEIAEQFPGRSAGAIEVRYHTKLKTAGLSRSGSRQLCDSVVGDDSGEEEEWEVEEICGDRTQDDGDLEPLVRWKGGEETWEPYENMAETEALDVYERLHGRVTVDTV